MTFTVPARPAKPKPMALDLLDELEQIATQAEGLAMTLHRLCLDPDLIDEIKPGSSARAQRSICGLETAAQHLRHLSQ